MVNAGDIRVNRGDIGVNRDYVWVNTGDIWGNCRFQMAFIMIWYTGMNSSSQKMV